MLAAAGLRAQARPAGAERFWLELGLGASRMDPNCGACIQQNRMGGPSASLAAGLTLTPDFGIALLGRAFSEFNFDISHDASYFIALAQFSPPGARQLTLDFGLGTGDQHGDPAPNGDNGSGMVLAGGLALRLPSNTLFGFTLNADVIKSLSGDLRTAPGQVGSTYRPTLVTFGLGVNLAGSSQSAR